MTTVDLLDLARRACASADVPAGRISAIRLRDNAMLRTDDRTVIRVLQRGQLETAIRELRAADWLRSHGVRAPEPLVPDPVVVSGRPVTFWEDLGGGGPVDPAETAALLRALHGLRVPSHLGLARFALPEFAEQIARTSVDDDARSWLSGHAAELAQRWDGIAWPTSWCVIHGDPSPHNTVAAAHGGHVVDLERCAIGPPEWDQATVAFQSDTLSDPPSRWAAFRDSYGADVTEWHSYPILRDIRSLELCLFALRHATVSDHARAQADYRLACIRSRRGERPWRWIAP
ncbi:phosphotransferase [Nocardia sp. NPDC057353]|uniref:phosphotransferase n=1 Tax=Nocardia sp. NPDC057353 TaxID=3346104 RepID=UPI00362E4EB6